MRLTLSVSPIDRRKPSKRVGSFAPQRQQPILSTFTMQSHLPRRGELQVAPAKTRRFANTSTGIVEKQQQRVVAPTTDRLRVGLCENRADFIGFKIRCRSTPRLLCRNGKHFGILLRMNDICTQQVLEEASNRGAPAVARCRARSSRRGRTAAGPPWCNGPSEYGNRAGSPR